MAEGLFERNLEAMRNFQPHLAPRFAGAMQPYSRVVGNRDSGNLNIDLGHSMLYPGDAASFTEEQVDSYKNVRYQRIMQGWPGKPEEHDRIAERLVGAGVDYLHDKGIMGRDHEVDPDGGYLIVFGLGLGLHLAPLIERLDVRSVIVVEQFDEFLYHAMHQIELTPLFETIHRRNGLLNFVIHDTPEVIANFLFYMMRQDSFGLIDGSYIFDHYPSFVLSEAKKRFLDRLPLLSSNPGFFEDEQVMIRNYVGNVTSQDALVYADKPRVTKRSPVIVSGSGPSIDEGADFVRRHKDAAVVISCGTGLGALLGHGIYPDFHVEIENTPGPVEIIQSLAQKYDLSRISLIASNTVRPEMAACFGKRILFFRDSVCSSKLFGQRFGEVYYAAPTVANTAARIALGMGFRHLYLVGVDLGSRDASVHHGRHSVYVADEEFLTTHPDHLNATKYTISSPGNFGGTVQTNHSFLYASVSFSGLIARYKDAVVRNLSDGIRIPGSIPCLPQSAVLEGDISRKSRELERLRGEFDVAERREMAPPEKLDILAEALDQFYQGIEDVLRSASAEDLDLRNFYDAFKRLLEDNAAPDVDVCVQRMHVGTMMVCFTFLYRAYRRMDANERGPFFEFFRDTMLGLVAEMRQSSAALAADLRSKAAAAAA